VVPCQEEAASARKRARDQQTRLIKQQSRVAMLRVQGKRCAKPDDVLQAWGVPDAEPTA